MGGFESVPGTVVGLVLQLNLLLPGAPEPYSYNLIYSPRTVLSRYKAYDPNNPAGNLGEWRIAYDQSTDWYVNSGATSRGAPSRVGANTEYPLPPMPPTAALVGSGQRWTVNHPVTGIQMLWESLQPDALYSPQAYIRFDTQTLDPADLPCEWVHLVTGTNVEPIGYNPGLRDEWSQGLARIEEPPGTWILVGGEVNQAKFGEPPRRIGGPYTGFASKDMPGVDAGWGEGFWFRSTTTSPIGLGHIRLQRQWGGGGVSVPPPLRVRQRGDGLGTSVRRVKAPGSRQASPRVRGYL